VQRLYHRIYSWYSWYSWFLSGLYQQSPQRRKDAKVRAEVAIYEIDTDLWAVLDILHSAFCILHSAFCILLPLTPTHHAVFRAIAAELNG
jgi:hypothetical protein